MYKAFNTFIDDVLRFHRHAHHTQAGLPEG